MDTGNGKSKEETRKVPRQLCTSLSFNSRSKVRKPEKEYV